MGKHMQEVERSLAYTSQRQKAVSQSAMPLLHCQFTLAKEASRLTEEPDIDHEMVIPCISQWTISRDGQVLFEGTTVEWEEPVKQERMAGVGFCMLVYVSICTLVECGRWIAENHSDEHEVLVTVPWLEPPRTETWNEERFCKLVCQAKALHAAYNGEIAGSEAYLHLVTLIDEGKVTDDNLDAVLEGIAQEYFR